MPELNIDGRTSLYAITGKYTGFSPIPGLFNAIVSFMGYNSVMLPFDTEHYDFQMVIDALRILQCRGVYIDTPNRCDLDGYIISRTEEARICGAVNIIRADEHGYHGHNTEIKAFQRAFRKITGEEITGKKVFLIGAGGIARAIAVACAHEQCEKLTIINRTLEQAMQISKKINDCFGSIAIAANTDDIETIHSFYNADIIVNASSAGMFPEIEHHVLPKNYNFLPHHIVLDMVYNPPQTKLMKMAEDKGSKVTDTKDIMFYSCIEAFQWWTDVIVSDEVENKLFHIWKELIYNI